MSNIEQDAANIIAAMHKLFYDNPISFKDNMEDALKLRASFRKINQTAVEYRKKVWDQFQELNTCQYWEK